MEIKQESFSRKRSNSPVLHPHERVPSVTSDNHKRTILATSTEWRGREQSAPLYKDSSSSISSTAYEAKSDSSVDEKLPTSSIKATTPSVSPAVKVPASAAPNRLPVPSTAAAKNPPASLNTSTPISSTSAGASVGASTAADKISPGTRIKGPWTREEDELLARLVKEYGAKKWSVIASHVPGRIGKQCRERWLNHLDSSVKKSPWTEKEDEVLLKAQEQIGNRWCEIAKMLPGRPENAVKNRWNSLMNRRYPKYKSSSMMNSSLRAGSAMLGTSPTYLTQTARPPHAPLPTGPLATNPGLQSMQRQAAANASPIGTNGVVPAYRATTATTSNYRPQLTGTSASTSKGKAGKSSPVTGAYTTKNRSPQTKKSTPTSTGTAPKVASKDNYVGDSMYNMGRLDDDLPMDLGGSFDPIDFAKDDKKKGGRKKERKKAPPALTINSNSSDLAFGIQSPAEGFPNGMDSTFTMQSSHGTPRSVTSFFDRFGTDRFGQDSLLGLDIATPSNASLNAQLVGLSIDDNDFKDLLKMPLPPTPRITQTPRGGNVSYGGIKISDSLTFGDDFNFPSSTTSFGASEFNFEGLQTPRLTKCSSPMSREMNSSISRFFQEGKTDSQGN